MESSRNSYAWGMSAENDDLHIAQKHTCMLEKNEKKHTYKRTGQDFFYELISFLTLSNIISFFYGIGGQLDMQVDIRTERKKIWTWYHILTYAHIYKCYTVRDNFILFCEVHTPKRTLLLLCLGYYY